MSRQGAAENLATFIAAEEERAATRRGAPRGAPPEGWLPAREQRLVGKAARKATPRSAHAGWRAPAGRGDPLALLRGQDADRVPQLVPIRWGRMSASPFAFYRGAALAMAADLATTPVSGLRAQLCGDAHLMNFGVFGAPDRSLVFDVNDFDETLPGPWEWDVKRLAASVVIAARDRGFTSDQGRDAALSAVCSYRSWMARYAEMDNRDVWYSRVTADDALAMVRKTAGARTGTTATMLAKARTRDSLQAFGKLTRRGRRRAALRRPSAPDLAPAARAGRPRARRAAAPSPTTAARCRSSGGCCSTATPSSTSPSR